MSESKRMKREHVDYNSQTEHGFHSIPKSKQQKRSNK